MQPFPDATNATASPLSRQRNRVPWSFRQTVLGMLIPIAPWLLLSLMAQILGSSTPRLKARLSPGQDIQGAVLAALSTLIIEGAFLLVALVFARQALRSSWQDPLSERAARTEGPGLPSILHTLGLRRFRLSSLWLVVLFLPLLYVVNSLYLALLQTLHLPLQTNYQVILSSSKYAPITTGTLLILAVFVAPVCEEIFFRGFIFPGLQRGLPTAWAILVSALVFGIAHADPGSLAVLVVIGIMLAILRWRSDSLYPGMLLHMLNNGISALVILLSMLGLLH